MQFLSLKELEMDKINSFRDIIYKWGDEDTRLTLAKNYRSVFELVYNGKLIELVAEIMRY